MTLQDLKAQYDSLTPENSKSFIKSIRSVLVNQAISTKSLIGFLENILTEFRPQWDKIGFKIGQMSELERNLIFLHGKIAAALMILMQKSRSYSGLREKTLLFLTYSSMVVKTDYDFVSLFLKVLNYRVVETGLDWQTVQDSSSLDVLCYIFFQGVRFDDTEHNPFVLVGKGEADCYDGCFRIYSSGLREAGNRAFSLFDDKIEVMTRSFREERLKESEQDDVQTLARFATIFMRVQDEYVVVSPREHEYETDDVVDIRLTEIDDFRCVIIGSDKEVAGIIIDEELVKGTTTKDIIPFLFDGDCIKGAVIKGRQGDDFLVSIREAYQVYALRCAEIDARSGVLIEALVMAVRDDLYGGRITWMTASGYGGISFPLEGHNLKPGDKVDMTVLHIQQSKKSVFINLGLPKHESVGNYIPFHIINEEIDREAVLASFVTSQEKILAERGEDGNESELPDGDKETLRMLSLIMASRAANGTGLEDYRQILVSLFLANLIEDRDALESIGREEYYMRCCLLFSQGYCVPSVFPSSMNEHQNSVIRMLSLWDSPVEEVMRQTAPLLFDSLPWKIGSLILGIKLAGLHKDEISAYSDTVREKICSLIGVEPLFRTETVSRRGKYGRTESREIEFKSSYVFRNDNGIPDIDYQGRCQVFEAVCGFLNADGGTVFLGVNNDGNPLNEEDTGLSADIEWLRTNFKFLNGMRSRQLGHAICEVKDLDSYVQFLNSEKELYFKESLQGNIIIEVTDDADAIKITVAPAKYEIAYLYTDKTRVKGEAFVRDGGRTIVMSHVRKEQRLAELKKIGKEMGFVIAIQEAIDRQGKLLFKGYSSGNSGEVKDRQVVPINLFYNDENVYCYDLVSHKNKQFRLHRISSIEQIPGTYTLQKSSPKKADVFRWLNEGDKTYHIKLRMDVGARNYLLEEYSCAELLPESEFYEEKKNKWILDTHLNGLGAVRRFYLGLADKIEILDTEDSEALKSEIAEYVRMYVKVRE